jgi:mannose-6-phosphate isomerase-like protein (cupin superfamily)
MNPNIIDFFKIGNSEIGYISVAEVQKNIPFEINRTFWTYYTPHHISRGRHAHYNTQQVLIAVNGIIKVTTETNGKQEEFMLDKPNLGLYIPPNSWHTMEYSHNAVQLVFASTLYDESDYIRDYQDFINYYNG